MIRYVDPSGNLGERTLNGGVSILAPGDTLIVKGGAYFERLNDNTIPSGCTLQAAPGEPVVMYGNLWISQRDSITWDGIAINGINNGVPTDLFAPMEIFTNVFINGGSNIVIKNCEIYNAPIHNILIGDGNAPLDNIQFLNLKVHDPGKAGFTNTSGAGASVPGNHNFYIAAAHTLTGPIVVGGCEVYNAFGPGPNSWGIQVYSAVPGFLNGVILIGNYVHDNLQGIVCGSGSNHKVLNNILYNNVLPGSFGEAALTLGYGNASNMLAANNTIVGNRGGYGISTGPWGPPSNTRIENNILWGNGVDSVDDHGSGTVMQGNLMGVDPRFLGGAPLFALASDSPAVGIGANLSSIFTTDIAGNLRPASGPWSAGAYEVIGDTGGGTPPPPPPPPPPIQTQTCWDGSVIPIDQNCPPQPPPPTDGGKGGHRRPRPKPRG